MSLLQQQSLVEKINLSTTLNGQYQMKQSLTNNKHQKTHFQEKCLFANISRSTIFC